MIEPTSEWGKKLAAVASRLRVLHTELADQGDEIRDEQIRDEVQRALTAMQPQDRERFLRDLVEQFPVWGDGVASPVATLNRAPAPAPAPEIKDPKTLADKLVEVARGLNPVERAEIAARLATVGLIQEKQVLVGGGGGGGSAPDIPAAAAAEFKKTLSLPADATLDPARVAQLTAALTDFVLKLEPWTVKFWREVAPEAKNTYYELLGKEMARFAVGDQGVSKDQILDAIYDLRSLISLMLKGIADSSRHFARDHLSRYGVDAITRDAPAGDLFKGKDVQCWKHYQKLMEGVDGASMEKRLRALLAKDVDTGLEQVRRRKK